MLLSHFNLQFQNSADFFLGYINYCPGLVFLLISFLNYQYSKKKLQLFAFLWRFPALCDSTCRVISELGTSLQSLLGEQMFGSILTMCFKCTKIEWKNKRNRVPWQNLFNVLHLMFGLVRGEDHMPDVFSRTTPNWKPSLGFSADSSIPKWNILILWGNLLSGTKKGSFQLPRHMLGSQHNQT